MSPEQGLGERDIGSRSDIYSVGCVFYEMLVGEPPYTGPTVQAIVARHAAAEIPSLRLVRPDIPEEIETIVRKALGKVPAARFASASALPMRCGRTKKGGSVFASAALCRIAAVAGVVVIGLAAVLVVAKKIFAGSLNKMTGCWLPTLAARAATQIGDAYRDLVTTALKQSRFVRIMDRRQLNEIMRLAGIPETTYVDLELGRQLAQRDGACCACGRDRATRQRVFRRAHVVSAETGKALASAGGYGAWQRERPLWMPPKQKSNRLRQEAGRATKRHSENRPLRDVARRRSTRSDCTRKRWTER